MDRAIFRQGLHPLYLPYYDALRRLLNDEWQPVQGRRTFEEQADLYAQGRTKPGPIITRANPGLSFHNYGLASDWGYFPGGKYAPLAFEDPLWAEYLAACIKVGVRCIEWEKPHNEFPLKHPISWLHEAHQIGGMPAVETLLGKKEETWTRSLQS